MNRAKDREFQGLKPHEIFCGSKLPGINPRPTARKAKTWDKSSAYRMNPRPTAQKSKTRGQIPGLPFQAKIRSLPTACFNWLTIN